MLYKTIVLEMLQDRPGLYTELQSSKRLLPAMEEYAIDLKNLHQGWKQRLTAENPRRSPTLIASEALELALEDLQSRLPSGQESASAEVIPIDSAMTFVRRHTPTA